MSVSLPIISFVLVLPVVSTPATVTVLMNYPVQRHLISNVSGNSRTGHFEITVYSESFVS